MIQIRKLVAVDMVWLGPRIVLIECALGVVLPLLLGVWSLRIGLSSQPVISRWQTGFGLWLIGIALNCVPLFLYARAIAGAGTVEEEGRPELVRARRYGLQQVIILVPLLVVLVALAQAGRRPA
jgi:hypothetical protein